MAPGPCGGYGIKESLRSDFGVVVLRRKEHYQDLQRGAGLQKDGWHNVHISGQILPAIKTSNMDDGIGKKSSVAWVSRRLIDREPGELSSEDSSGIEDGVNDSEDKDDVSSCKKRKLSPIESQDDGKSSVLKQETRIKERPPVPLQSYPSMKSFEPISAKKIRNSEDLSDALHHNDDFVEQLEEDYVPTNSISLSRWADANFSFEDDEDDTSDVDFLPIRRKNMLLSSAQDLRPESGAIKFRDGSEGSASGSDGLCREACLKTMADDIDGLDACGEDSNGEESDGSFKGCRDRALDSAEPPSRSINMLHGCRTVDEFEKLNKINEGTYGVVYRARDKRTGEIVALKKVKMEKEREGFPLTSLREINILLSLHHPSIVEVKEVVVGNDLDGVFTVMEYMEHDLKGLIEMMKKPFHLSEVKCLMLQLFAGVKHLHDNWVLHRDLKTSNLLFNNRGELKICDFGLSRQYGSPLKPYTMLVVTLWYRAPELLLGAKEYSTAIDMWSLGCIMAELLTKEPLFPGKSELDQLDKIFRILGTPNERIWPGFSRLPGAKANFAKKPFKLHEKFPRMSATFLGRPLLSNAGFDLLNKLLAYDPEKRITAEDALNHPWFCESPLPTTKDFMPTFPAQHRQDRHQRRIMKSPDPLEQLMQKDSQ